MEVEFFKTTRGDSPVENYIEGLDDKKHTKKIIKELEQLEEYGLLRLLQTHDAKKFKYCKNLYQLTVIWKKVGSRMLFSVFNNEAWILHAFTKKTNETPRNEIKIALNRKKILMKELNLRNKKLK